MMNYLIQLLTRDPLRRLGSGETDAVEIKSHAFFKDTNWDDIMNKRVPSPFFPSIVRVHYSLLPLVSFSLSLPRTQSETIEFWLLTSLIFLTGFCYGYF